MNTRIIYRYRDAANYKAYSEIIVEGVVTRDQFRSCTRQSCMVRLDIELEPVCKIVLFQEPYYS